MLFSEFLQEAYTKPKATVTPKIGSTYKLSNDKTMGDYAGDVIKVETGPRNGGTAAEQYRVSWGKGNYDVDWIDTWMFNNSEEMT